MRMNFLRKQSGQAVVEMTLGFLLFFTIFMSIVEFSHLLYAKVTLQHALRTAGRYMVTGQTKKDGNGNDIPRSTQTASNLRIALRATFTTGCAGFTSDPSEN